ncbi:protein FAM177B-like [Gouania willdenowi]|uniref:protein FAM177B-like n=1 Tax=Gouania willdenowi TaxID=441366 RepID=UPI0010553B4A|nr:protein FAM177B-like [Gouania willdenowi]
MSSRQQDDDTLGEKEACASDEAPQKKKKIIYFSSGETLMEEDSDEEEDEEDEGEPAEKASLRRDAVLIGRASLLSVDFLGQRLSAAFGLNAAKYQYVIEQYHQNHHMRRRKNTKSLSEGQEEIQISTGIRPSHYGSTGSTASIGSTGSVGATASTGSIGATASTVSTGATGAQENQNHQHMDRMEGTHNRGYQPEDDVCK